MKSRLERSSSNNYHQTTQFSYWHTEGQKRVGELEGKACEEKKNFADKVKIAKMIVGIVTFESLQPMVTEASTFERD